MDSIQQARLAQSVEHQTRYLRVVGSSPTVGKNFTYTSLRERKVIKLFKGVCTSFKLKQEYHTINFYSHKKQIL